MSEPEPIELELSQDDRSVADRLADLTPAERRAVLEGMSDRDRAALLYDWKFWARPTQIPPAGDWQVCLFLAGLGAGKSRSLVEWARTYRRIFPIGMIVGPTPADVRDVLMSGPSGFLTVSPPSDMPVWEPSKLLLTWPNGDKAYVRSAAHPERIRGPEVGWAIADELRGWRYAQEAWDNLQGRLRLGPDPRTFAGTTPRPTKLIKGLLAQEGKGVVVIRSRTLDNAENLAPNYLSQVLARWHGTRLGRQELEGEMLEDVEGAMWSRELIELGRVERAAQPEQFRRIVVAIDPSWGTKGDDVGIIAAGLGYDGHCYVLDDRSGMMTPAVWGNAAAELFDELHADKIIAESNFQAEQVRLVVNTVNTERRTRGKPPISFGLVRASQGKRLRAEPVLGLYEQKRVHHCGELAGLEDQMTSWVAEESDFSPGRIDAMVYCVTELMLTGPQGPSKIHSAKGRTLPALGARPGPGR